MADPSPSRPPHVRPPAYLSPNPPVPAPAPALAQPEPEDGPSPVRYGDWEKNGIAIDF